MKTEFVDVNETRKNVRVEIPQDVVAAEIDRVARDYSRRGPVEEYLITNVTADSTYAPASQTS